MGAGFAEKVREIFGVEGERKKLRRNSRRCVTVRAGSVTLLCGDSGAGKSTLLRTTVERLRAEGWRVADVDDFSVDDPRAIVETFEGLNLAEVLSVLSRAGLAEAAVLLLPAARLSAGEQFRYRLARAIAEAEMVKPEAGSMKSEIFKTVIVCDEFAALLDRVTARVVAFGLRKRIAGTKVAALVATSHDDLAEDLGAEVVRV